VKPCSGLKNITKTLLYLNFIEPVLEITRYINIANASEKAMHSKELVTSAKSTGHRQQA